MEQIGYSLIDRNNTEVRFWGDVAGVNVSIPEVVVLDNGDRVHAPKAGQVLGRFTLVPRMLQYGAQESITSDGTQVVVTRIAPRRLVTKSLIIERLNAAGKIEAAFEALQGNAYNWVRWTASDKPAIYADDPDALALLEAIGASPDEILAPE